MPDPIVVTLPGGITLPMPRWVIPVFGLIAIVSILFGLYRYFYPVEPELISAQQANRTLQLEVNEYNSHIMEVPQLSIGDVETLRVTAYEDGCMVVSRKFAGKINTRLLVSPTKTGVARMTLPLDLLWPSLALEASQQAPRCLNPHPDAFAWRYGERAYGEPCWIPVIRTWKDGCEHYQMFNTCSNTWDTLPNGAPNVRWTRCVHTEAR